MHPHFFDAPHVDKNEGHNLSRLWHVVVPGVNAV
jgi:hypothetical protein